jgi:hypothetical protein
MPDSNPLIGLCARWDDAPDLEALGRRVTGARGVHAAVWLRAGSETCLLLFLDSSAMRDAYAHWLRSTAHPPDRIGEVELLAATPGRAGADPLLARLLAGGGSTTVHR